MLRTSGDYSPWVWLWNEILPRPSTPKLVVTVPIFLFTHMKCPKKFLFPVNAREYCQKSIISNLCMCVRIVLQLRWAQQTLTTFEKMFSQQKMCVCECMCFNVSYLDCVFFIFLSMTWTWLDICRANPRYQTDKCIQLAIKATAHIVLITNEFKSIALAT